MSAKSSVILGVLLFLFSCNNNQKKINLVAEEILEQEVICNTIFELAPKKKTQFSIVHEDLGDEKLNQFSLDSVKQENQRIIDSLGLEIWLIDQLTIPSPDFFRILDDKNLSFNSSIFQNLKEKNISMKSFDCGNPVSVILVKKNEPLKVNTIGTINYSRIVFNATQDTARFIFNYQGENCTDTYTKLITVRKIKNKWEIIKK